MFPCTGTVGTDTTPCEVKHPGNVAGEDRVLAGVPGTLLHHVGARVLGDSIHMAGVWVGEGRLEPES